MFCRTVRTSFPQCAVLIAVAPPNGLKFGASTTTAWAVFFFATDLFIPTRFSEKSTNMTAVVTNSWRVIDWKRRNFLREIYSNEFPAAKPSDNNTRHPFFILVKLEWTLKMRRFQLRFGMFEYGVRESSYSNRKRANRKLEIRKLKIRPIDTQ